MLRARLDVDGNDASIAPAATAHRSLARVRRECALQWICARATYDLYLAIIREAAATAMIPVENPNTYHHLYSRIRKTPGYALKKCVRLYRKSMHPAHKLPHKCLSFCFRRLIG